MKFVTADQRTPEWYAARLGRVTGSRIKDMVDWKTSKPTKKNPFPEPKEGAKRIGYRKELVTERLIGDLGVKEVFVNEAMRWGVTNEPLARLAYQLQTGNKVTEEGFCQHDELMAGASTDGNINNGQGCLEIKCLEPYNHLFEIVKKLQLPDQFRDQVQFQLWITEREFCHFVGYDSRQPPGLDLFIIEVEREEDYINYLAEETKNFLAEVDQNFQFFLRYLPVCERACRNCGTVFTDQISICPECRANNSQVTKVIRESEFRLNQLKKEEPKK